MYSTVVLIVLFLAIVVLGVILNKGPSIPDGFQDAGFCARMMPNELEGCRKFYFTLGNIGGFRGIDEDEDKVAVVQEYIRADRELQTRDGDKYRIKTPQEQYRSIKLYMSGGEVDVATESSRARARIGALCPSDAYYDANGIIHVEPAGKTFTAMTDYTNYVAAVSARNNCKPIEVRPFVGRPSAPGVATSNGKDSLTINKALSDLFDFAGAKDTKENKNTGEIPVRTFQFPAPGEQTYAKTPINSLDDYEYNRVFELENRPRMAELSKQIKNNLLGALQLDWPILPYSSEAKAVLEEQFVDARMQDGFRDPKSGVFFKNMEGVDISPPDEDAAAAREAKILSAYQPTDITTHVVDDEYERVAKVVAQQYSTDPDWEPVVEKRGPHQYAVTELRPRVAKSKDGEEEVVWEGEEATTVSQARQQGLMEGGDVKPTSMTIQDNLQDPFFAKTGVADHSNDRFWRYDQFSQWTPGLERMFAPTDPTNEWK